MRYLGLDLGTTTLGVAISDKTNTIASPWKTIRFPKEEYKSALKELQEIVLEKQITDFVLGYPKHLNNTTGDAVERTINFKNLLESTFSMPVYLIDERLSTVEAEKILISVDRSRKERKKEIDAMAAALILETFLEKRKEGENEREY